MKSIIKGQTAVLVSMLAAFAITLTACGGGSSSSSAGGGTSFNTAKVSGTVTSNGIANLDRSSPSALFLAISDAFMSTAHADDANQVEVTCNGVSKTSDVVNGQFSVQFTSAELGNSPQNCQVVVDGVPALSMIDVAPGSTTTVRIVYDDGQTDVVSSSGPIDNPGDGTDAIAAGDVTSSDDDSIASTDSVDDDSDDSESEDEDSESDDDSSDTTNNV